MQKFHSFLTTDNQLTPKVKVSFFSSILIAIVLSGGLYQQQQKVTLDKSTLSLKQRNHGNYLKHYRYSKYVWGPSAEAGSIINKQKQYDITIHLIACQWQAQLCLHNCWVSLCLHVLISHSRTHNHSMTTDRVISKAKLLLYHLNPLFLKDTVSYNLNLFL